MGLASPSAALADATADADAAAPPRPPGLGLGATFIPHSLSLDALGGLERRLGARLTKRGREEEGGAGGRHKQQEKGPGVSVPPVDSDGSDGGGRGAAVRARTGGWSRDELLAPVGKRRKKKKKGGG